MRTEGRRAKVEIGGGWVMEEEERRRLVKEEREWVWRRERRDFVTVDAIVEMREKMVDEGFGCGGF